MNVYFVLILFFLVFVKSEKLSEELFKELFEEVSEEDDEKLKRYDFANFNYTLIMCGTKLMDNDTGQTFKIFFERSNLYKPCMVEIPSKRMVWLYAKLHAASNVAIISGYSDKLEHMFHVSPIIAPRLEEPTFHGPYFAPCNHTVIVFRARSVEDTFLFSFLGPSEDYIDETPDPPSCIPDYHDEKLRKVIGSGFRPRIHEMRTIANLLRAVEAEWEYQKPKLPTTAPAPTPQFLE